MSFGADPILRLAIVSVITLSSFTVAFMAYAFVLHVKSKRLERRRNALEARWRDRLLDAATGEGMQAPDPDNPRPDEEEIGPKDRLLLLELITQYARALDGPERANLERVAAPYLDALNELQEDGDPYRRAYALDILGELGFEQTRAKIVKGLDDESGLVAMVAARALARHGDPEYVPLLLQRMDAFENWSGPYLASLFTSFGAGAAPSLRELAMDPSKPARFRSVALRALRTLNDMDSVEPAAKLLPDEPDPEVQADLIRLIGTLGRPDHLGVIRPHIEASESHLRAVAVRAVSNLSDRRTSDLELVSRALDDPSPWVALQAAHGLVALGRSAELAELAASSSPRAHLAAEVLEATP
jgi:hypothetical protein